jgi:hypothetical protein
VRHDNLRRRARGAPIVVSVGDHGILTIREERVIVDSDLARLYGVPTKALNQAVKRNAERFPPDFCFRLTAREKKEVVTNCDHLQDLRYSPTVPRVFTEHGALMAANVLNSPRAFEASIALVRRFVRLQAMVASHADLARRLDELESRSDSRFKAVFEQLRRIVAQPPGPVRRIGFRPGEGQRP